MDNLMHSTPCIPQKAPNTNHRTDNLSPQKAKSASKHRALKDDKPNYLMVQAWRFRDVANKPGSESLHPLGLVDLSTPRTLVQLRDIVRGRAISDLGLDEFIHKLSVRWSFEWKTFYDVKLRDDTDLELALGLMAARGWKDVFLVVGDVG
jgi:hypothetical protein